MLQVVLVGSFWRSEIPAGSKFRSNSAFGAKGRHGQFGGTYRIACGSEGRDLFHDGNRIEAAMEPDSGASSAGAATAARAVLPVHAGGKPNLKVSSNDELSADWFLLAA